MALLIDPGHRERMRAWSVRRTAPMVLSLLGLMIAPGQVRASGVVQEPRIYGGDSTEYCGWPSAVYVEFENWRCSGTLVHPDIVITAAHCPKDRGGRSATIHFGERFKTSTRSVEATCYSGASWNGLEDPDDYVGAEDYGYCKLERSVTDVPIIPPAYGCEVDELVAGKEVVIVGFGKSNSGLSGTKRQVKTTINSIDEIADIGGGGLSTCFGDSGGPVFAQISDGSWRAFGITSGGEGITHAEDCGGEGIYALMHVAIPWIEEHSDVDITPCHDVDGAWSPTPACGDFPLDPEHHNGGDWNGGCSGGPTSDFSGLCGQPFELKEDVEPPIVAVISPDDGTVFELAPAEVPVSVSADDGDGVGVASVRLLVNGQEFAGNHDAAAPYEWPMVFPKGVYTLTALAVDFEGNEALSAPVVIGVEQAPEGDETESSTAGIGSDGGSDVSGGESVGGGGSEPIDGCSCSSDGDGGGGRGLAVLFALGLGLRRRRG